MISGYFSTNIAKGKLETCFLSGMQLRLHSVKSAEKFALKNTDSTDPGSAKEGGGDEGSEGQGRA